MNKKIYKNFSAKKSTQSDYTNICDIMVRYWQLNILLYIRNINILYVTTFFFLILIRVCFVYKVILNYFKTIAPKNLHMIF